MIRARFDTSKDNKTLSLNVKGHSGLDNTGKDIICACVTILVYTLAQAIKDIKAQDGLEGKVFIKLDSGDAEIICTSKKETYSEVLHTFFIVQTGFNLLAHNYPKYVKLKMIGEGKTFTK